MKLLFTDRMRDQAATPVLDFGEDAAWYQTRSGAAQDDVVPHQGLYVPEDVLLDLKLLEHTLLKNTSLQERMIANKHKYNTVLCKQQKN